MFAPVNECSILSFGPWECVMLWSVEIVPHHVISLMTLGQTFLSTARSCKLYNAAKLD